MSLVYQTGFANEFASEALEGALPPVRNSPQRCPFGLYAEQISGTAFTVPRHASRRSWLYRIRPAVVHGAFHRIEGGSIAASFDPASATPNQLRWGPLPIPEAATDFVQGLVTIGGSGSPSAQSGCAIYWYVANRSMAQRFFYDADGELLLVPQLGRLRLATELGIIELGPLEIAVIPRGIRFRVELLESSARGYVCENFGAPLDCPTSGRSAAMDSRGRAISGHRWRHSRTAAANPSSSRNCRRPLVGATSTTLRSMSSHGTAHARPTSTICADFNAIGSISYDHPDPSIFSGAAIDQRHAGVDALDFLIFGRAGSR